MRTQSLCLTIVASTLAACATVQSDFDLGFSDIEGFHDDRLDRIDAAIEAEIEAGKIAGAGPLTRTTGSTRRRTSWAS